MIATTQRDMDRSPMTDSAAARRTGYRIGRRLAVLSTVREEEVSLAVYRRCLPGETCAELTRWASTAPSYDQAAMPDNWDPCDAMVGIADASSRNWLCGDLSQLLAYFSELSGAPRVRVNLRAVKTDACRKFHLDFVRMRLITTYLGPGTEWLPRGAARTEVLDSPPACSNEANRAIVRDRRAIRRAQTGDVLLMKGERHGPGVGVVHRSPPIEHAGITRLVLTLSALEG